MLETERRSAVARGQQVATIDATILRELLQDAYSTACAEFYGTTPETYYVHTAIAIERLRKASTRVRYHRPICPVLKRIPEHDWLKIDNMQQIELRGYLPCMYCRELTLREWCRRIDLDQATVSDILNRKKTRIRKLNAIKILRAIGEEPHEDLLEYAVAQAHRKHQRQRSAVSHDQAA